MTILFRRYALMEDTPGAAGSGAVAAPAAAPAAEVDEFAAMFDHLASGGDPNAEPGSAPAPAPAPAPVAAPAAAPAVAEGTEAAAAPTPAPAPPAPAPAPAPTPAPAAPAPAPVAPPAPAPAPYEVYTPEEKTQLTDLAKEWPDIDRMIELKMRKLQYDTLVTAFQEMNKSITPLSTYMEESTATNHSMGLYQAHEDYDEVYPKLQPWIDGQPAFLRNALNAVAKDGDTADVVDMISQFKKETNWKPTAAPAGAPAAAPAAAAAAVPGTGTLSAAARKAAGSLAAVNGKRTAQPQGADPNDFDAAWAEASTTD